MSDLALVVNGRRYGGWKSIRVTRSIESFAGSFALEATDRWGGQDDPLPIAEEDECRVEIDGTVVIDGYVGTRDPSFSASSRVLAYSGRDRAGVLVDCSAVLTKWTFRSVTLADFATTLAKPFGVRVSVQPGLTLAKIAKIVVHPGDTPYEAIQRAAVEVGVLVVSDATGGLVITRAGATRATSLVEGVNLLSGSAPYSADERYHRYVVVTQVAGTDEAFGEATRIQAEAIDEGVRRKDRVLLIRPDKGMSVADARRRADWEARVRAARAESPSVSVLGWKQPNGQLWPINAIAPVRSPSLRIDGNMLISQVEYSIGEGGEV